MAKIVEDIPKTPVKSESSQSESSQEENPNNPYYPHSWDTVISQEDTILAHLAQAPHFFWRQGSSFAIGPGPIPYYARGLRYEVSVLKKLVEEGKIAWEPPSEPQEGNDPSQVSKFLAKRI